MKLHRFILSLGFITILSISILPSKSLADSILLAVVKHIDTTTSNSYKLLALFKTAIVTIQGYINNIDKALESDMPAEDNDTRIEGNYIAYQANQEPGGFLLNTEQQIMHVFNDVLNQVSGYGDEESKFINGDETIPSKQSYPYPSQAIYLETGFNSVDPAAKAARDFIVKAAGLKINIPMLKNADTEYTNFRDTVLTIQKATSSNFIDAYTQRLIPEKNHPSQHQRLQQMVTGGNSASAIAEKGYWAQFDKEGILKRARDFFYALFSAPYVLIHISNQMDKTLLQLSMITIQNNIMLQKLYTDKTTRAKMQANIYHKKVN